MILTTTAALLGAVAAANPASFLPWGHGIGHTATTPASPASRRTPPPPSASAKPEDTTIAIRSGPVKVSLAEDAFLSWAVLDRTTGRIAGSANLGEPSDTMSMIKAWIAADYLRLVDNEKLRPSDTRLAQISIMIRDSDNAAAESLFKAVGARDSIERMIRICRLTESSPYGNWWSNTTVTARDTVRMGACLADGRAAGRRWTPWLLNEMRMVRGAGDFGVRSNLPAQLAATVAIKNGWLLRDEDDQWHISCLAITDGWVMSALARYPGELGFRYGAELCGDVGRQLVVVPGAPVPR